MTTVPENGVPAAPGSDPALVEESEVRAMTHVFLFLCMALVVGFLAWSWLGRLDIVSTASGEVVPSSQAKSVQHLEGGIISEILVREGDEVTKDQPLVVLESTTSGADVKELTVRLTSLRVDLARLEAELVGADEPVFPGDIAAAHPHLVNQAIALFETRRSRLDNQIGAQRELVTQRSQEIKIISARLVNEKESLKLLKEQVAISEDLLKDDLTNRMLHLNLLKDVAELKGRIGEDEAAFPSAVAAHKEAQVRLAGIRDSDQEQVRQDLDEKRRSLDELSSRMSKFEDSLKRTVLRSPVDGVVNTLYVTTVGGVVAPGDTVVDLVPGGDRLVVEAQLPVQDVGYVHPGQTATVQLASADAVRFGNLDGEVVLVSPDTKETADGIPYYKVRIEIERDYFERRSARYRLVPGVAVMCNILTGTRSVMEYILNPFIGGAQSALRER